MHKLTSIDPPAILDASPMGGYPLIRKVGDPAQWSAPPGCRYLPVVEQSPVEIDPLTHRRERLPDAIVGDEIHTHRTAAVELTQEEAEAARAAASRKIWTDSAAFLAEFSMEQIAAISLSTDPTIAALRLFMAAWKGEVWSDDPRVVAGLDACLSASIITQEQRAAIVAV